MSNHALSHLPTFKILWSLSMFPLVLAKHGYLFVVPSPPLLSLLILVRVPFFSHLGAMLCLLLVCVSPVDPYLVPHFSLGHSSAENKSRIMSLSCSGVPTTNNQVQTPQLSLKIFLKLGPHSPILSFVFYILPPCLCTGRCPMAILRPPSPHTHISPSCWSTAHISLSPGRLPLPICNKFPFLLFIHRYCLSLQGHIAKWENEFPHSILWQQRTHWSPSYCHLIQSLNFSPWQRGKCH